MNKQIDDANHGSMQKTMRGFNHIIKNMQSDILFKNKFLTLFVQIASKHRLLVAYIICIWFLGIIANRLIDPHLAFISGEHIFSFDYLGHINNILEEFRLNPHLLLQTNTCENCPYIYHYSRWHALINFVILSGSQLLKMNPFIYEVVLSLTVIATSTYFGIYFINSRRVSPVAFCISTVLLSLILLNFIYLGSGRYPIQTSVLLLCIGFAIGHRKNIFLISNKSVLRIGITSGILGFIFLNTGIEFLPIYLYSVVSILLIPIFRNPKFFLNQISIVFISLFTTGLLNLPITASLLLNGNARRFDSVNSLTETGSYFLALTSNLNTETGNLVPYHVYIVLAVFIALALITFTKYRVVAICCICTYLLTAGLMQGNFIYMFLFKHAPFMDTLRSVHRLSAFQHIAIFFVTYYGLVTLLESRNLLQKILAAIVSMILVFISIKYTLGNLIYPDIVTIPKEYFQIHERLAHLPGKKVYFPTYLPPSQLIQGNYNWFVGKPKGIPLYTNIFSSLFTASGIQLSERYEVSLRPMELRSLLDHRNSYSDLQESLMTQNIRYVILDRNFAWGKNFPGFELERFVKPFKLLSTYGNLDLYEIETDPKRCSTAYGRFTKMFCYITHDNETPQYLVNTTNIDYVLQRYKPQPSEQLERVIGAKYYGYIVSPALQDYMLRNGIPFYGFFTLDNEEVNKSLIYRKHLSKGNYILILNSIKIVSAQDLPPAQNIEIMINTDLVAQVSPYSNLPGIYSTKIPIHITNEGWVNVYISAKGFSNLSEPYLIEKSEYEKLLKTRVGKIPVIGL